MLLNARPTVLFLNSKLRLVFFLLLGQPLLIVKVHGVDAVCPGNVRDLVLINACTVLFLRDLLYMLLLCCDWGRVRRGWNNVRTTSEYHNCQGTCTWPQGSHIYPDDRDNFFFPSRLIRKKNKHKYYNFSAGRVCTLS